jgi:hypothetical protein
MHFFQSASCPSSDRGFRDTQDCPNFLKARCARVFLFFWLKEAAISECYVFERDFFLKGALRAREKAQFC